MNRLENDLQFGRYVSYTRTNSICDHCGRTATLKMIRESLNQTYLWICGTCESRLLSGEWHGSRDLVVINGSQFQPRVENINFIPSVWTASDKLDKVMSELKDTVEKQLEKKFIKKP